MIFFHQSFARSLYVKIYWCMSFILVLYLHTTAIFVFKWKTSLKTVTKSIGCFNSCLTFEAPEKNRIHVKSWQLLCNLTMHVISVKRVQLSTIRVIKKSTNAAQEKIYTICKIVLKMENRTCLILLFLFLFRQLIS